MVYDGSKRNQYTATSNKYEYLCKIYKSEFGKIMSDAQTGSSNSCYGLHWYTNRNTGECKKFKYKPNDMWFLGRNLFRGECCNITNKEKIKTVNAKKKIIVYNIYTLEKMICQDGVIPKDYITPYKKAYGKNKEIKAKQFWDKFHAGGYKSFKEFSKILNVSQPYLTELLKWHIPKYKEICKKRFDTQSDKSLIGVYE